MLLIDLLNSLSEEEKHAFRRFVRSDFYNNDSSLVKLLEVLLLDLAKGNMEMNEKSQVKIFNQILGKSSSNEVLHSIEKKQFNYKTSALTHLGKQFLTILALEKKPASKGELLYTELKKRKLVQLYKRQLNKDKKALAKETLKGTDYYWHAYQLEKASLNLLNDEGKLAQKDNLETLLFHFNNYVLLETLELKSTAISLKRVFSNKNYKPSIFQAIDSLDKDSTYTNQPLVIAYHTIINLMETDNELVFKEWRTLLQSIETKVPNTYLKDFYIVAVNFCIRKITRNESVYYQYLYELYREMDKKNLFMEENFVDINRLRNVVGVSCRVGDFEWAKNTIEKYKSSIQQKIKKSIVHYNYGVIAFLELDYKQAIYHFIRTDKINLGYDINGRVLMLKSHYELDEDYDERTMTIFRTADKFIKENKYLSTSHKRAYRNFILILINIYRVRHKIGKMTIEKVMAKIDKMGLNSDKKWLLEKIAELKKQKRFL